MSRETYRGQDPRRESEPAYQLEEMIDRHSLAKVLDMLAGVCGQKASHIEENWQDYKLAKTWDRAANRLHTLSEAFRKVRL